VKERSPPKATLGYLEDAIGMFELDEGDHEPTGGRPRPRLAIDNALSMVRTKLAARTPT
jgi:hypothetical protein